MQIDLWHISGRSFHFGRHGMGQEATAVHLASDTLFSALTARQAALGAPDLLVRWTDLFLSNPALVFSSAFPRAAGLRFYPVPMLPLQPGGLDSPDRKALKRLQYLSEALFIQVLQGASLVSIHQNAIPLMGGSLWVSQQETSALPGAVAAGREPLWQVVQRPRVTIARLTNKPNLFFTGQVAFHPDCGLWFGVRWVRKETGAQRQLETLLADLADAGLGGERSSGFGAASIQPAGSLDLPDSQGKPWVTLSRYLPAQNEISALQYPGAAYSVEPVGGWLQSAGVKAERRQQVNMLAEGAVLGPLDVPIPGLVVDVQPVHAGKCPERPVGHPVLRSGLALAVGITLEGRAA